MNQDYPKMKIKSYTFDPQHTIKDLANILQVSNIFLIKKLIQLGIKTNINQIINEEIIESLRKSLDIEVIYPETKIKNKEPKLDDKEKEKTVFIQKNKNLIKRTPILTIMGHVDHGKTTLLDTIRKTKIVDKEFGGITQHIGAYEITFKQEKITILDSPGHEAFFHMRSRGAQITDICLLVIAVDDGVKPQTIESIKHAQKAKVDIIVVLNKIDKPNNKKEIIMSELSRLGLTPEIWGGETIYIEISALKKEGIEELLQMILLISDIKQIQTDLSKTSKGVVVEAQLDKNKGPIATLISTQGILKVGDVIIVGETYGKIRSIENDLQQSIKKALPSQPIVVTGLDKTPKAGDHFMVVKDKKIARKIIEEKQKDLKNQKNNDQEFTFGDNYNVLELEEDKKNNFLNVILKADTQGSVEAIAQSLEKLNIENFQVKLIKKDVGIITIRDIHLAKNFNAILINFNTKVSNSLEKLAQNFEIKIKNYNILYKMLEDIEEELKKLIKPVFEEKLTGKAEIRKIFYISSIGTIAGCYVLEGTIFNKSFIKIIRNKEIIFQGNITSLKHLKNNISSAIQGHECGILLDNFNSFEVNDIIESYKKEKKE